MPEFSDIPNLPTVRAVVKEVLRWRPVTAGGVPHELVKADSYQGYTFKAGTVFHPNQWAIHRDPELYPDPETFNPDQWLSPDFASTYREPLTRYPNLQNYSYFGFGRRICPGQNIAERSLNILVARIAWAAKFQKKKDENKVELPIPSYDYTVGFNFQPRFFPFDLKPRSPTRTQEILDAYERARKKRE
jgi:cytochrome P450